TWSRRPTTTPSACSSCPSTARPRSGCAPPRTTTCPSDRASSGGPRRGSRQQRCWATARLAACRWRTTAGATCCCCSTQPTTRLCAPQSWRALATAPPSWPRSDATCWRALRTASSCTTTGACSRAAKAASAALLCRCWPTPPARSAAATACCARRPASPSAACSSSTARRSCAWPLSTTCLSAAPSTRPCASSRPSATPTSTARSARRAGSRAPPPSCRRSPSQSGSSES
ncbi:hypothetical protein IWQ57_005021, partial [Coemansia nantahalensis]